MGKPETTETAELAATSEAVKGAGKPRGARIGILAGLGVAALVTLYLLTMTVLWGLHHHSLTSAQADLTTKLDAEQAIVASQADELATLSDGLNSALVDVSQFASDKAKYQDHIVIYRYNDQALVDCADARLDVSQYVKSRYLWVPGPLHAWDNEVTDFCNTSVDYFTQNVENEEAS